MRGEKRAITSDRGQIDNVKTFADRDTNYSTFEKRIDIRYSYIKGIQNEQGK